MDKLKKLIDKKWDKLPFGRINYFDADKNQIEDISIRAGQEKQDMWYYDYEKTIVDTEQVRKIAKSTFNLSKTIIKLKKINADLEKEKFELKELNDNQFEQLEEFKNIIDNNKKEFKEIAYENVKLSSQIEENKEIIDANFNVHIKNMEMFANSILEIIKDYKDYFKKVAEELKEDGYNYTYKDVVNFINSYGFDRFYEEIWTAKDEDGNNLWYMDKIRNLKKIITKRITKSI